MTPAELKAARHSLGLSAEGLARLVHVESGRTVRRWESGERDIPGPVKVLVTLALAGPEWLLAIQQAGESLALSGAAGGDQTRER